MKEKEREGQDKRWIWAEGLLAERKRLNRIRWLKKKLELKGHRKDAVFDLEAFKLLEKFRPIPPSKEEMIFEMAHQYHERYQKEMAVKVWDFQIAFFESKFNPRTYAKFLVDFQMTFADYPEGECEELGIEDNLEFFSQVAEKLGIFKKK
jgi:hypothetical protein